MRYHQKYGLLKQQQGKFLWLNTNEKRYNMIIRDIVILLIAAVLMVVTGMEVKAKSYQDVEYGSWFYSSVADVSKKGIMTGYADGNFGPMNYLTRGELATIIYRIHEKPETIYRPEFPDVTDGKFYSVPVTWAHSYGVITGYEDGNFGPENNISREELATMLYRYAQKLGYDVSEAGDISVFPDAGKVSKFAKNAMIWANGAGIITGDSGMLNPQGTVNRAVGATMLSRFTNFIGMTNQNEGSQTTPSVSGGLSVQGTQLVDEKGDAVQLKGISTHGLAWFPQYVNEDLFREFRENWDVNVIRLAMYTAESGGYCTDGDKRKLKELVRRGVEYATNQDMYVIIDWHILSDHNPNQYKAESIRFFSEMSKEFSGHNNVLYEICNEPNGGTTWGEVKSYANEVIPVIRANDPDALILVGTPNWSQYVNEAAADPITGYDNIMYTLHFYAATHTDYLRETMAAAINAGAPIFVSEYGICDASGNGAINEAQANVWVDLMDQYEISYVAWNLSNKNESSSIIRSTVNKVSGFSEEDLSDSGRWLYHVLTGERGGPSAGGNGNGTDDNNTGTGEGTDGPNGGSVTESGEFEIRAVRINQWEAEGRTFYQYMLTVKNTSTQPCQDWEVNIKFNGDIALSSGWNGKYSVEGNILHISSMDYNGKLDAGGSTGDVGFIISGATGVEIQ